MRPREGSLASESDDRIPGPDTPAPRAPVPAPTVPPTGDTAYITLAVAQQLQQALQLAANQRRGASGARIPEDQTQPKHRPEDAARALGLFLGQDISILATSVGVDRPWKQPLIGK